MSLFRRHRRGRVSSAPPFPRKCAERRVDGGLLRQWQTWVDAGCPGIDPAPGCDEPLEEPARSAARVARWAVTAATEGELCDMARSEWAWVRLAIASNPHAPLSAIWGDGIIWFGLAGDDDPWVRAAAIWACPEPPQSVVDAVLGGAAAAFDGSRAAQ